MKSQKINLAIKILVSVIIVFAILILIAAAIWHNFTKLDYFKIKDIVASENNVIDLSYLKGQNIFSVDLEKQSRYLSQLYPVYRKVRLVRILPSRIYVDFIKRKTLAYIKLYKYFSVDEESVLFDVPVEQQSEDLPVILGLETRIFGPKSGKKFNLKELTLALTIIRDIQTNRLLRFHRIKKVDLTHPLNTSVFLELPLRNPGLFTQAVYSEPVEIKIGQTDIQDKVNMLANLFIQLKKDWFNIKYIDLRFKEPAIKFRDKDAKK